MVIPNEPPGRPRHVGTTNRFRVPGGLEPTIWHVASPPSAPGELAPELASRLLDAYTRPGDLAIDVDKDVAVAAAAAVTGRHYAALGGETRLAALSRRAGTADLVVMRWPRPQANPRWLLVACRSLLRTDGRLAIAVTVDVHQRAPHLSALIGAARTAAMGHRAHIVVLGAPFGIPEPDQEPRPDDTTDDARVAPGATGGQRDVHCDFLIFVRPD
jgi:hypothetical protein